MATCNDVRGVLEAYLDRELSADRVAEVRDHVGTCATCAAEVKDFQSLDRILRSVPVPEASVRWDRYVDRLRGRLLPVASPRWRMLVPAALAAAVMLALVRAVSMPEVTPRRVERLLREYGAAPPERQVAIENAVRSMGEGGFAVVVASLQGSDAATRTSATRLLARLGDDRHRALLLDWSRRNEAEEHVEWELLEIGSEPTDVELVGHAIELARREVSADEALRILRKLDRGGLNRRVHAEILSQVKGLLTSDVSSDLKTALRLIEELEILLEEDVVEFLDVPALRDPALRFLRKHSGQELGPDPEAWRDYFRRRRL